MNTLSSIGLSLCRIQAEVFESSTTRLECSSAVFVRRFMNSKIAKRMDNEAFYYEACDINDIINELEEEYGESNYGQVKYGSEELYWIGYIYRYWSLMQGKSSKHLYRIIKPEELRRLYFPYHTFDPVQAIERIIETKALKEDDMISKGVAVMRKLYYQEKQMYDDLKRAQEEYAMDRTTFSLAEVEEHLYEKEMHSDEV